jgi:hypothetical protein
MSENEDALTGAPAAGGEAGADGGAAAASGDAADGGADGGQTTVSEAAGVEAAGGDAAGGDAGATGGEALPDVPPEEIGYHAVEKDGQVTAIWEMQGRKHLRTIDPRSRQGQEILRLYTAEHHEEGAGAEAPTEAS